MIYCEEAVLEQIALHHVGNKLNDDGIRISESLLDISDKVLDLLRAYFTHPFTKENSTAGAEYYHLYHDSDLTLNEVYSFASRIFDASALPEADTVFHEQSVALAKHLYEQSTHPKIKGGEFYVVSFRGCIVDGETVDAVGLFKSENKDTFLRVYPLGGGFEIESEKGVNINKLDKGCLIFNTERENGYLVAAVDNTNRGAEAQYWMDEFLHVRQRQDDYYQTANTLALCKSFVTKQLPQQYEVSKAEQADLLNKSVAFFKEKESFDLSEFTAEVMEQPEVINSFKSYKADYEKQHDLEIAEQFDISTPAVKRQARAIKSVIKLDKNFHIYVHGNRQFIRKGFDEQTRMHFYQLFFEDEA